MWVYCTLCVYRYCVGIHDYKCGPHSLMSRNILKAILETMTSFAPWSTVMVKLERLWESLIGLLHVASVNFVYQMYILK